MSRALWLRFAAVSVLFALLLSALYLLVVREIAASSGNEVQRSVYLFIARIVEQRPYAKSIAQVERFRAESPAMPMQLWVVSADGSILASNNRDPLPEAWHRLARPVRPHEVVTRGRFFSGAPAAAIVRLQDDRPTYLVVRNRGEPGRRIFLLLGIAFVAAVAGAMLLGLLLIALYLRGRSREVKQVIARIEAGDLGARFAADRLDTAGGLMLDFNRMADQIQRLVARLQATETARRELLQELGHDLRTPLTSLRTAIETLAAHGEQMSAGDRAEFFAVVTGELGYFRKLVDDLFFIAELDEPGYRLGAECIDLTELLGAELRTLESSRRSAAQPTLRLEMPEPGQALSVRGSAHLVSRLFRNVLDNAARYARNRIRVTLQRQQDMVAVTIEDDGPGMSAEAIASFGQRHGRRLPATAGSFGASLGLGSVIVKTIVELHGGRFRLESCTTVPEVPGTRLTLWLPAA